MPDSFRFRGATCFRRPADTLPRCPTTRGPHRSPTPSGPPAPRASAAWQSSTSGTGPGRRPRSPSGSSRSRSTAWWTSVPAPVPSRACSRRGRVTSWPSSPTTGCAPCSPPRCPGSGRSPGGGRRSPCRTARPRACSRRRRGTGWTRTRRSRRSTGCSDPAVSSARSGPVPIPTARSCNRPGRSSPTPVTVAPTARQLAESLGAGAAAGARTVDRLVLPDGVPFGPVEQHTFVWDVALNADELIGLLGTLSWVILMPVAERAQMFDTARRLARRGAGHRGRDHGRRGLPGGRYRTFAEA